MDGKRWVEPFTVMTTAYDFKEAGRMAAEWTLPLVGDRVRGRMASLGLWVRHGGTEKG